MNLEIREDSQYTFVHTEVRNDLPWLITSALISIIHSDGTTLVDEETMSVVSNVASYNVDFSIDESGGEYALGANYRVVFNIDGKIINRFFDIVRYPFENPVIDQDLIEENPMLRKGQTEEHGQADSGTVSTLIDTERNEPSEYWYGGEMTIIPLNETQQSTVHKVTDYNDSTQEFTFDPPRATAITTENYVIRRSYQQSIDVAGEIVREDLWKNNKRAYLLLDSSQLKRLIIYKFFERYWGVRREAQGDHADLEYARYSDMYKGLISSVPLVLDADDDGVIDEDEKRTDVGETEIVR